MMSMNLSDTATLNIKTPDYFCIITKIEVINLMQNTDLVEKRRTLKKIKIYSHI